jgi:acetylornithine deacetylase/succinyl-diaminopimelate desuccinylase-like protein
MATCDPGGLSEGIKIVGIGKHRAAAFFRRMGYHAAAFSKIDRTAHQPNEYCRIENMLTIVSSSPTAFSLLENRTEE